MLACRNNGFSEDEARDAVLCCVRSYRERMAEYSDMRVLDVWYASIDVEGLIPTIQDEEALKRFQDRLEKARERSVLEHEFPELVTTAGLSGLRPFTDRFGCLGPLLPAKTTASGRVTLRASSDPACLSHSRQGLGRLSHDSG